MASTSTAEEKKVKQLLEQIRRLPHNKNCVNCGKTSIAGHGDICVKSLAFVCHTCKSAHQSFSHRCKSVSLSNWTLAEVQQLSDGAGGGNLHARATWLGKLPEGKLVLRPDDSLDTVKAFVRDAYEHKRYYVEAGSSITNTAKAVTQPQQQQQQQNAPSPHARAAVINGSSTKQATPQWTAAAPATDFLDFEADFQQAATPTHTQTPPASAGPSNPTYSVGPTAVAPSTSSPSGFAFINHQQQHQQQNDHANQSTHTHTNTHTNTFAASSPSFSAHDDGWEPFAGPSVSSPSPSPSPAPAVVPAPHHDFGDFMAATPAPAPAPMQQTYQQQQQQQQQTYTRPAPPAMMLARPLVNDPFAGLVNPSFPPHMHTQAQTQYQPQQQQYGQQPMFAPRGPPPPPPPSQAFPPQQFQQQQRVMMMQQPPRPVPPPPQQQQQGYFPNGAGGVGVGGGGGFYKAQEPDPFASLMMDWKK